MAPLTWRDTAAPNFYPSIEAQRLAGQSLNNAFSGASDALGRFHDWQQGQAGTALANNLAQYPDAASEAAARANGTLFNGVDRANLTPQALGTINSNASTLLSNAADAAKLPFVGPAADAGVQATQASTGFTQAQTGSVNQSTGQNAALFGRGTLGYNDSRLAEAAAQNASTKGIDLASVDNAVLADPTLQSNPQAMLAARARARDLFQGVSQPANAAIASAAGSSTSIPAQDEPGSAPAKGNNPGNIIDGPWASRQPGYVPGGGRFATFDTVENGSAAMGANLQSYAAKGVSTLNQLTAKWAPKGDGNNDPVAYAKKLSQATGIDPDAKIDLSDPATVSKIIPAMAKVEQGHVVSGLGPSSISTSAPDITGDFFKSMGRNTTVNTNLSGMIGQQDASGIAGVYGAASRDNTPYGTIAANLVDPKSNTVFTGLSSNKVQAELENIRQIGAKYGVPINGAVAGAIMSDYASKNPLWFQSWRDGANVQDNSSAMDAEVKQIASGARESQLQNTNAAKTITSVVQSRQQAASDAYTQLKNAVAVARQRNLPSSALKPYYDTYNNAKSQWDAALDSASQPRFKPKFNTNLNANSPSGAPAAISNAAGGYPAGGTY